MGNNLTIDDPAKAVKNNAVPTNQNLAIRTVEENVVKDEENS